MQQAGEPGTAAAVSRPPLRRWARRAAGLASLAFGLAGAIVAFHVLRAESAREPAAIRMPAAGADRLRVLAYNVHLLPGLADTLAAKLGAPAYRAARIAAIAAEYDLVGLCEVFDADRRRELLETVERVAPGRFAAAWSPKPSGYFTSAGLVLLSRFPIEGWSLHTFDAASTFADHGLRADGFAAKGVLHGRVRLPSGVGVDCFVTHLDSRTASVRDRQVDAVARFIAEHSAPERPILLLGDLNVDADVAPGTADGGTPYRLMLTGLARSGRVLSDVWPLLEGERAPPDGPLRRRGTQRKDYVFAAAPAAPGGAVFEPVAVHWRLFLDERVPGGALSDHPGVECEVRVR